MAGSYILNKKLHHNGLMTDLGLSKRRGRKSHKTLLHNVCEEPQCGKVKL